MTKAVFAANLAEPYSQTRQIWHCPIPVDPKLEISAAIYDDLLRPDYWVNLVNTHHVEAGDLLVATAKDLSFSTIFIVRGVDKRNLLVVVAPLLGADFGSEPILIGKEIIIQRAGESWSVSKKISQGALELIRGGFAHAAEAEAWCRRLGAQDVTLVGSEGGTA